MRCTHFVIVSPAYCGASLICSALGRHPQIQANNAEESIQLLKDDKHLQGKQAGVENPQITGYVVNIEKHPPEQDNDLWQLIKSQDNLQVIALHRENLLEHYLQVKAKSDGDINSPSDKEEMIEASDLVDAFEKHETAYHKLCDLLQDCSSLHFSYESIVNEWDVSITQIQFFLGVQVLQLEPDAPTDRFNPSLKLINSAVALQEYFKGSPWEDFFGLSPQIEDPSLNPVIAKIEANPFSETMFGSRLNTKWSKSQWIKPKLSINAMHPSNSFSIGKNPHWHGGINIHGRNNTVIIGDNFSGYEEFSIQITGNNNRITIGDNVTLNRPSHFIISGENHSMLISDVCTLSLRAEFEGNNSHVVFGTHVTATGFSIGLKEPSRITFGDDCMLAVGIRIDTSDMHGIYDRESGKRLNPAGDITIGDHVWLGRRLDILKGVTIGNGSIIGASSVVRGDIPENCIAVGSPARVVRENILWTREIYDELNEGFLEQWEY